MSNQLNTSSRRSKDRKNIGLFRILTSIFGGFLTSYLGMTALALVLPFNVENTSVVSLFFNTLTWAFMIIWIAISNTKLIAFLRFFVPSLLFSIIIFFLY